VLSAAAIPGSSMPCSAGPANSMLPQQQHAVQQQHSRVDTVLLTFNERHVYTKILYKKPLGVTVTSCWQHQAMLDPDAADVTADRLCT
jgi:hypothetical protein